MAPDGKRGFADEISDLHCWFGGAVLALMQGVWRYIDRLPR
jgi:hypothetical protein